MIVKIENLVKRYGDVIALDNINLEVKKGEILGLLGPNGSGKTTIINCMLSILNYNSGNIVIFGKKMSPNAYDIKSKIGLVPQEVAVIDTLNVEENIDYFCGLYVNDKKKRKELVKEAIDFVKLESHKKYLPKKLSEGLKRRLNIACGIAHKPEFLILDEPTVAIDAQSRNFILNGVKEINRNGTTVLYTSHYLEEVEKLCDRIIIMDKGENIAEGSKDELVKLLPANEIIEIEFVEGLTSIEEIHSKIKAMENFLELKQEKEITKIRFKTSPTMLEDFLSFLKQSNLAYRNISFSKPSLNEVFLYLTGKELRE